MGRPQKLTLDFFIHDAHASDDRKIIRLRKKHGNDGYAAYFTLLELCCKENNVKLSLSDPEDIEIVALTTYVDEPEKLAEIIQFCAEMGLFSPILWESQRIVYSELLGEQLDRKLERRVKDAGRKNHGYEHYKDEVFSRDGNRCVYCGSPSDLTLDHVVPQSKGGEHSIDNLATCCASCNSSKGAKDLAEWEGRL
jgi:hypothetical protein